jgi:hypothetical protein
MINVYDGVYWDVKNRAWRRLTDLVWSVLAGTKSDVVWSVVQYQVRVQVVRHVLEAIVEEKSR